jgi:ABC-type multidrug transport system fused ATPase/permease subunit
MFPLALNPFLIKQFIDNLTQGVFSLLLGIGVIGLAITNLVLNTYNSYVVQVKQREGARDLASEVYTHLQSLPLSFFKANSTGELMSKTLGDTYILGQQCVLYYPMLFINLLALLVSGAVLFLLEWRLAFIALAFFPVCYLLVRQFNWRQRQAWEKEREGYAKTVESLREKIEGVAIIKGYHQEELFKQFFSKDLNRWFGSLQWALLYERLSAGVLTYLPAVLGISLLVLGAFGAFSGWTSLGAVIAFFWYLNNLYDPIAGLVDWNNAKQQIIPMGKRVLTLLAVKPEEERQGLPLPSSPTIVLSNIFAGYDGKDVLHSINLELRYGRMTAIVGQSGSGKSSLASLLLGFICPTQGDILINGLHFTEYETRELRKGTAFATSEAFLFNLSIRDNISLGRDFQKAEIIWAAKMAEIHNFITGLPQGYETVVGERGIKLSNGERQRIALARALIRHPKILILDEATSGVDSKTEARIYGNLRGLHTNLIVIAHRLSTIYMADRIIVLEGGRIVGEGTHAELLDRCSVYRALFEKQLIESAA